MITFTTAPSVAAGDPITSTQMQTLAAAFNDRLRSGLGDPTWRIFYYILSMCRQIRNSDDAGNLFPPQAEYLQFYSLLDPTLGATWPTSGPGDPEGVNLSSGLGTFVFGSAAADMYSEDERLTDPSVGGIPLWLDQREDGQPGPPLTDLDRWTMAQLQRGSYDPSTGGVACPAFTAARDVFKAWYSWRSQHGNSYGGFMPLPAILGDCGDGTADTDPTTDYEIKFTRIDSTAPAPSGALMTGEVATYPGTCPGTTGDVQAIAETEWAFYVYLVGGTIDVLPRADWIEGPYTGGSKLMRQPARFWSRMLQAFVREFRGSDEQRSNLDTYRLQDAFDFQAFLTAQYPLAPQVGVQTGDMVAPIYPLFRMSGTTDGSRFVYVNSGGDYTVYESGTVIDSCIVKSTGLKSSTVVRVMDGDDELARGTVTPDAPNKLLRFTATTPTELNVRLVGGCSAGSIEVECTKLLEYKPSVHDAYLVLRCATGTLDDIEGRGIDESNSHEVWNDFDAHGCIENRAGLSQLKQYAVEINTHPVVDAVRRMTHFIRFMPRQAFIGYEVTGGKSICYFKRYAFGMSNDVPMDYWQGMLPIVPTAAEKGWTNEWLMGCTLHGYHWSDSSIWKPDAYSDYWPWQNRCMFYWDHTSSNGLTGDEEATIKWQFDYGAVISYSPEALSGYNYVFGINSDLGTAEHFKSCRIYEPDPEIESIEEIEEDGEQRVKVTFKTRFHNTNGETNGAPASVDRDITTWDHGDLELEPYRTMENGLREYLLYQSTGAHCTTGATQPGNAGINSDVWALPDAPYGTCFPKFLFTKLIPAPYADSNDRQDKHDTVVLHDQFFQMELYLRAMCEGCVDTTTTLAYSCESGVQAIIDYTFPNLCYDAFGGRWLSPLGTAATDETEVEDMRPDAPQSHGPLPNTQMHAETFNQFSNAINLLNKYRIELPFSCEVRSTSHVAEKQVMGYDSTTGVLTCTTMGDLSGWADGTPTDASGGSAGSWAAGTSFTCDNEAMISDDSCGDGGNFVLESARTDWEFKLEYSNADLQYAVPSTWSDMIGTSAVGCLATVDTGLETVTRELTSSDEAECPPGNTGWWFHASGEYWRFPSSYPVETTCEMLSSGSHAAPVIGFNSFGIGRASGSNCNTSVRAVKTVNLLIDTATFLTVPLV